MFDHLLLKPEGPTDLLRVSVWLPVAVSLCWAGLLPPTDAPGAWRSVGAPPQWAGECGSYAPPVELSTSLREVSRCPKNGPTRDTDASIIFGKL